jgi:hypothetical protein
VALGLEYNWDPDARYARAAFADRYLPDGLKYAKARINGAKARLISTAGDTEHWETKIVIYEPNSAPEILELLRERIAASNASGGMFKPIAHMRGAVRIAGAKSSESKLKWDFTDDLGRGWNGTCLVAPSPEKKGEYLVTFNLALARKTANSSTISARKGKS